MDFIPTKGMTKDEIRKWAKFHNTELDPPLRIAGNGSHNESGPEGYFPDDESKAFRINYYH